MKIIILAGGGGTRLWPLSRQQTPKQFQRLLGDKTMLQESVERLFPDFSMSDIFVATHETYAAEVQAELPNLPKDHILTEPEKRDTAAGLGLAGWRVPTESDDEVIAFLPADHYVGNPQEFRRVLLSGQTFLSESSDTILTVGITPHTPEIGYGYIKYTSPELSTKSSHSVYPVEAFTEKPDKETALSYLRHGGYVWNAGIFLTTKTHLQHVYRTHVPQMAQTLDAIGKEQDHQRVKELYTQVEKISFDYAILEHTDALAVIPAEFGWSDIGSWKAVKDLASADTENAVFGANQHMAYNSQGVLIHSTTGRSISTIGVKDLVIVDTQDALLVTDIHSSQHVKNIVEQLEDKQSELL